MFAKVFALYLNCRDRAELLPSCPSCQGLSPARFRIDGLPPSGKAGTAARSGSARRWGRSLTELRRQHWDTATLQTPSHPSLRQYAHLTGEQLWVKIDSTLRFLGQPLVEEPPAPVVFGPNPVASLLID